MALKTFKQWTIRTQTGIGGLDFSEAELPESLSEHEVLCKIHAASLNYRDLMLIKGGKHLTTAPNIVPGSDGAGIVIAVGTSVTSFSVGDQVITHLVPSIAASRFPAAVDIFAGLGQAHHGTLRQYGVFHEDTLIRMPKNLSFEEAATLTCSGLTAWNALFGDRGVESLNGKAVLTQGTGGVSVAALQFANAAGATVISTTSSDAKAARLKSLGAANTINYRTSPNWGEVSKSLSPNGEGFYNIVDVGGLSTLSESFKAVAVNGTIALTGVLGEAGEEKPDIMDALWRVCSVRGLFLGTRDQFNDMVKFIEENDVRPVFDEKVFGLGELEEALMYLEEQKHFSKVVIRVT
ncbi:GroES-like protein [Mollisia scopiformis]|uniref:GroES-like protein n=1 Tax=Mollisia scopiformis TaxID=149040 RepID=A0A194WVL9_MOLSC|nr:GroES-like protein [Mollisia scopiformis]KUJ11637.1 GroES-like protein [Mollisia scopiformis]